MKKYLTILQTTWQRALTYRFTTFSHRIGEVAEILFLLWMWSIIFKTAPNIGGYNLKEMMTYILIGNLVNIMTRNFLADVVAKDINEGRLSLFLTKPIAYLNYIAIREIGRISLVFLMSLSSQILLIIILNKHFIINLNPLALLLIIIMIGLAFIMELLISFMVGLIAFWTNEVDGIYATLSRLRKFFAGGFFPLSILPAGFITASALLPFAYSFFIPTQIYLGKMSLKHGATGLMVQLVWIVLLYILIRIVWYRGIKRYEGVGI